MRPASKSSSTMPDMAKSHEHLTAPHEPETEEGRNLSGNGRTSIHTLKVWPEKVAAMEKLMVSMQKKHEHRIAGKDQEVQALKQQVASLEKEKLETRTDTLERFMIMASSTNNTKSSDNSKVEKDSRNNGIEQHAPRTSSKMVAIDHDSHVAKAEGSIMEVFHQFSNLATVFRAIAAQLQETKEANQKLSGALEIAETNVKKLEDQAKKTEFQNSVQIREHGWELAKKEDTIARMIKVKIMLDSKNAKRKKEYELQVQTKEIINVELQTALQNAKEEIVSQGREMRKIVIMKKEVDERAASAERLALTFTERNELEELRQMREAVLYVAKAMEKE